MLSVAVGSRLACWSPAAAAAESTFATRRPEAAEAWTTGAHATGRSWARTSASNVATVDGFFFFFF